MQVAETMPEPLSVAFPLSVTGDVVTVASAAGEVMVIEAHVVDVWVQRRAGRVAREVLRHAVDRLPRAFRRNGHDGGQAPIVDRLSLQMKLTTTSVRVHAAALGGGAATAAKSWAMSVDVERNRQQLVMALFCPITGNVSPPPPIYSSFHVFLAADLFEDMELLYPLYRLREEEVAVTVAGLNDHPVMGKKGHGPVLVDTVVDGLAGLRRAGHPRRLRAGQAAPLAGRAAPGA